MSIDLLNLMFGIYTQKNRLYDIAVYEKMKEHNSCITQTCVSKFY